MQCKMLMPWGAKNKYVPVKYQRTDNKYMNQSEISLSFFEYWCCGLTRTKFIKIT